MGESQSHQVFSSAALVAVTILSVRNLCSRGQFARTLKNSPFRGWLDLHRKSVFLATQMISNQSKKKKKAGNDWEGEWVTGGRWACSATPSVTLQDRSLEEGSRCWRREAKKQRRGNIRRNALKNKTCWLRKMHHLPLHTTLLFSSGKVEQDSGPQN